ncbi:hypothetical protein O181_044355 [Austropuccinia psidii MF-1]|uniref:Reverse transcriptase domain-containing protein n=1 Tax=Austropuccinia psidii MF-1 TaxID=1389203 RepID=A0A9Q3HK31_9BASI|nr:hypothetical protein [Austropuccinia psidii MF-1]
MRKEISVGSSNKVTYKEELVTEQLVEEQISPSLSPRVNHELINVFYTYINACASDNEPLGTIRGYEVDIGLDIDRKYPPVLRRSDYPASFIPREALEKHIQELIQRGVLRNEGHNEEVQITTPVIIDCHNDKSRMVGDFRAMNTYKVPNRYPIPRIQTIFPQWSKAKYKTSMDVMKGFHQFFLIPKGKTLSKIITHCGIYEYLGMPFGIKNAPPYYHRMMNTIFPTEYLKDFSLLIYLI